MKYLADDTYVTFGPFKIYIRDSDWLKSLIDASPWLRNISNHCLGHLIRNPVNVIRSGHCNGSNVIIFNVIALDPFELSGSQFCKCGVNLIIFSLSGFTTRFVYACNILVMKILKVFSHDWPFYMDVNKSISNELDITFRARASELLRYALVTSSAVNYYDISRT